MTYPSSDTKEGYKNSIGTGLSFEGLASVEDMSTIPISIDVSSRDWLNPDGSTMLRPWLAMGYDSSSGRYKPFDNALHLEPTLVVLAEQIRDIDNVVSNITAVAFWQGTFKKNVIIEPTAVTWTEVQRIKIRDNA